MGAPAEYTKAITIDGEFVGFYADLCRRGAGVGTLEEFSFLVEWLDAAEAAQARAIFLRDWGSVDYFDSMVDQANSNLDLWHEQA